MLSTALIARTVSPNASYLNTLNKDRYIIDGGIFVWGGCYRVILESLLIICKQFIKFRKGKMLTSSGEVYMTDVNILDIHQIYIKKNFYSRYFSGKYLFFQNPHFFQQNQSLLSNLCYNYWNSCS